MKKILMTMCVVLAACKGQPTKKTAKKGVAALAKTPKTQATPVKKKIPFHKKSPHARLFLEFAKRAHHSVVLTPFPITFTVAEFKDNYRERHIKPEKGHKYLAVRFSFLSLLGPKLVFTIEPDKIGLKDRRGGRYREGFVVPTPAPSLKKTELTPGERATGWVTFEVPENVDPEKCSVQYVVDQMAGRWIPLRDAEFRLKNDPEYRKLLAEIHARLKAIEKKH